MPRFAELEIQLQRQDDYCHTISFRFQPANDDGTQILPLVGEFLLPEKLPDPEADPVDYGRKLSAALFNDTVVESPEYGRMSEDERKKALPLKSPLAWFNEFRKFSPVGLRIRLVAPDLQPLRWETLVDPDPVRGGAPLFADGAVFLSRYLNSQSRNPARSQRKDKLSALVVIASAKEVTVTEDGAYKVRIVKEVHVEEERSRIKAALGSLTKELTILASNPASNSSIASLSNIKSTLRTGIDILYLVCHGELSKAEREPKLWLESEDPKKAYMPIAASELIRAIGDLPQVPRLIVLASCQSAGTNRSQDSGTLAALGPRLIAEAGVGAVVAMQGNISTDTVGIFMPSFFESMLNEQTGDGQMDRAMTIARGDAKQKGRPDYWIPALFTRMPNGTIWHEPGFAVSAEGKDPFDWSGLCGHVKAKRCVPIIGPDLAERIFGRSSDVARELGKVANYPMSSQDAGDLAKVTQFMKTKAQADETALLKKIGARFHENARTLLPKDAKVSLENVAKELARTESDPLSITASLDAKVYVAASNDALFEAVLRTKPLKDGTPRQVVPLIVKWRDERRLIGITEQGDVEALYERAQTEQFTGHPTPERPCLYYMFGKRAEGFESSMVLTEDDFFDYLIQTSKYDLAPQVVSNALASGSLLFLGFSLDDWKFRVLLRMVLAIEGTEQLSEKSHVGVQIDPDQSSLADVARAKRYLEDYYFAPRGMRPNMVRPRISIYWGTSADFLMELNEKLKDFVDEPLV